MRTVRSLVLVVAFSGLASVSCPAQHHHGGHSSSPDAREKVTFPPMMEEHTLANMRDHLAALQEIQEAMSNGDAKAAATIAEKRLGMTSLESHGAAHSAPLMPQGMRDAGTAMHRAASRFATIVIDASVTGDTKAPLRALSEITAACVGCHAGYRLR